ncbi:MAG: hypothetical protein QHH30_03950 [candidate division NC10 bacterium]|nr:hypothetical protein [candidate division NC10 bacterium]
MTRGIRLLIIVAIGVALFLYVASAPKQPKRGSSLLPSLQPLPLPKAPSSLPQDLEQEQLHQMMEKAASGPWRRDPFLLEKEGVYALKPASDNFFANLKLSGIIWAKEGGCAVVNDWVVKVGDEVGGAIVTEIRKDHLVLEMQGKRYILRLRE